MAVTEETLTARQTEALEFIESFIAQKGYSPSVRELAAGIRYKSSSTAAGMLERLEKKGYISCGDGPRTIRVMKSNRPDVANGVLEEMRGLLKEWNLRSICEARLTSYEKGVMLEMIDLCEQLTGTE